MSTRRNRKTINKTRTIRHRMLKTIKIRIESIIKIKINKTTISYNNVSFNQTLTSTSVIDDFNNLQIFILTRKLRNKKIITILSTNKKKQNLNDKYYNKKA